MKVGDFLNEFVKFVNETPKALVYTDTTGNGYEFGWKYIKSIQVVNNCVLLNVVNQNSGFCFLDAQTILVLLQKVDPSLELIVECEDLFELSHTISHFLEYDRCDPKEIFFYVDIEYGDEEDWSEDGILFVTNMPYSLYESLHKK